MRPHVQYSLHVFAHSVRSTTFNNAESETFSYCLLRSKHQLDGKVLLWVYSASIKRHESDVEKGHGVWWQTELTTSSQSYSTASIYFPWQAKSEWIGLTVFTYRTTLSTREAAALGIILWKTFLPLSCLRLTDRLHRLRKGGLPVASFSHKLSVGIEIPRRSKGSKNWILFAVWPLHHSLATFTFRKMAAPERVAESIPEDES